MRPVSAKDFKDLNGINVHRRSLSQRNWSHAATTNMSGWSIDMPNTHPRCQAPCPSPERW